VEMGTFLAILAGTIGAGVMMASDSYATVVAGGVVGTAVLGYLASRQRCRVRSSATHGSGLSAPST